MGEYGDVWVICFFLLLFAAREYIIWRQQESLKQSIILQGHGILSLHERISRLEDRAGVKESDIQYMEKDFDYVPSSKITSPECATHRPAGRNGRVRLS